jgi:hypothetical protein
MSQRPVVGAEVKFYMFQILALAVNISTFSYLSPKERPHISFGLEAGWLQLDVKW